MKRIVVGISGASGAIYGVRFLELLRGIPDVESHLVISDAGRRTIVEETDYSVADVEALATRRYRNRDIGAALASGSFKTEGMVIVPCSIRTAGAVAHCISDTLVARAADVTLKEGRRLILVVRESPLHLGHLRVLTSLADTASTSLNSTVPLLAAAWVSRRSTSPGATRYCLPPARITAYILMPPLLPQQTSKPNACFGILNSQRQACPGSGPWSNSKFCALAVFSAPVVPVSTAPVSTSLFQLYSDVSGRP